jgi:hypothetical protein
VTKDDGRASLSSVAKTSSGVGACFALVVTSKKLHTRIIGDVWSGTIRESRVESVCRVDRVYPCRVYIDLNRYDSQI